MPLTIARRTRSREGGALSSRSHQRKPAASEIRRPVEASTRISSCPVGWHLRDQAAKLVPGQKTTFVDAPRAATTTARKDQALGRVGVHQSLRHRGSEARAQRRNCVSDRAVRQSAVVAAGSMRQPRHEALHVWPAQLVESDVRSEVGQRVADKQATVFLAGLLARGVAPAAGVGPRPLERVGMQRGRRPGGCGLALLRELERPRFGQRGDGPLVLASATPVHDYVSRSAPVDTGRTGAAKWRRHARSLGRSADSVA